MFTLLGNVEILTVRDLGSQGGELFFLHPLTEYLQQYSLNSNQKHTECKASEVIYFRNNHKLIVTSLFAKLKWCHKFQM